MLLTVLSTLFILWTKNPLLAILGLISVFINSSLLLLALDVHFLALIYVVIYVGAICVLFLFVVMLLNLRQFDLQEKTMSLKPFILSYFLYIIIYISFLTFYEKTVNLTFNGYTGLTENSEIAIVAFYLLENPLVFILITLLLLLAIIAPIIVATNVNIKEKRQNLYAAMSRTTYTEIETV